MILKEVHIDTEKYYFCKLPIASEYVGLKIKTKPDLENKDEMCYKHLQPQTTCVNPLYTKGDHDKLESSCFFNSKFKNCAPHQKLYTSNLLIAKTFGIIINIFLKKYYIHGSQRTFRNC